MFRGRFDHTIDDKGRVSLPTKFREILRKFNDTVFITTFDGCLYVYPEDEWIKFEDEIYALPTGEREMRDFQRYILAHATECTVDKQGRLLIPNSLRTVAQLEKEIVIAGRVKHFEIWNKERFDQTIMQTQNNEPGKNISAILNTLQLKL
jgi:MraZ protein